MGNFFKFSCRFRSRWLRIPFEELDPKLKGQARIEAEKNLRDAMDDAHKSIPVVTSWLQSAINQRIHDEGFVQSVATVEEFAEKNAIDQRAQNMFAVLLFCTRKVNYMAATVLCYLACQFELYQRPFNFISTPTEDKII